MTGDLSRIRLLVTDVDGCWTDCTVLTDAAGNEWLRYSKRDGVLLPAMREAGIEVVALTSEQRDGPHRARAAKLGVEIHTTTPDGKLADLVRIASGVRTGGVPATVHQDPVPLSEIAYLGDDLPDLPCLEAVAKAGGAAFVPDYSPVAALDVSRYSNWPKKGPPTLVEQFGRVSAGGDGCLRDVCERLLKARGYDLTTWPVRKVGT